MDFDPKDIVEFLRSAAHSIGAGDRLVAAR
jgi:hypothetical protein